VKFSLLYIVLFLYANKTVSQVRASQFYATPLLYNPATTGRFDKNYRLGLLFRNEVNAQANDFKQSILSFDTKILSSKLPENDCLAIGIVGMSENGISEGIKNSYLSFSLGYQKALDEDGKQQIGIGFQNTFARKTITKPDLTFESDLLALTNFGYTNIDIYQIQNTDFSFNDFNVGLIFQGAINNKNFYSAGVSVYNITTPKKDFVGGTFILPRQLFTHASFQKEFKNSSKLFASFLIGISNQNVNKIITGLTYDVSISRKNSFLIGGWFRKNQFKGNSLIPNVGLNFRDFTVNFSFDINMSSNTTSQRGAGEASLKYTIAKTKKSFLEKRFILF
jgi:type IX secretion system PorP/SprF family membrane protein